MLRGRRVGVVAVVLCAVTACSGGVSSPGRSGHAVGTGTGAAATSATTAATPTSVPGPSTSADPAATTPATTPPTTPATAPRTTPATPAPARASIGCSAPTPPVISPATVALDAAGLAGTYEVHLPPTYDGTVALPVVVGLHGWMQPAPLLGVQAALPQAAAAHGFVLVLPDITRPVPLWDPSLEAGDVAWFAGMLDAVERTLCVDAGRIHVTGMSNGAMMASTVACAHAGRVASVAAVAGLRPPEGCRPSRPVPLIAFHGTDDAYLSFTGGYGPAVAGLADPSGTGTLGSVAPARPDEAPVRERAAVWAELNGCPGPPVEERLADDVAVVAYRDGCAAPALLHVVEGGGHSWPGSEFDRSLAAVVGATTMSIDATEVIWRFFVEHPLPEG